MNIRLTLTAITLTLAFVTSDIYADSTRSSWASTSSSSSANQAYVGGAYGKVSHDYTDSGFEEPNSIELLAGIQINENLAIEGSYLKPGNSSDNFFPEWTISLSGFTIGAVGKHPVSPTFDFQVKAGLFFWDIEVSEDGFGTFYENDGSDIFFGLGYMAKATKNMSLGMHYNFYEADDDDFDILQAQMQLAF